MHAIVRRIVVYICFRPIKALFIQAKTCNQNVRRFELNMNLTHAFHAHNAGGLMVLSL